MTDSIDVIPSEENGNVPIDSPSEETPNENPEGDTAEPVVVEEEVVTPAVEQLFELPDGRKVTAEVLQTEWKQNFYPEFTRKSQELADLKNQNLPTPPPSPYSDPEYVPESYEEILKVAEQRALDAIEARETQRIQQQEAAESAVIAQLEEVKKIDSGVDENKLFLHANKYGFRDLKLAHQNMQDMSNVAKTVQKNTVQNIAKRNDPVSVAPGNAVGSPPDPTMFETATEYLRSLK